MKRLEIIKQELKRIEQRNGVLTPSTVLAAAESETSPLHRYFEWDQDKAAVQYRLQQARGLISSVQVTIDEVEMNGYENISVMVDDKPVRAYVAIEKILTDEDMYKQVRQQMVQDLEVFQTRYKNIEEAHKIINETEVTKLKEKIK